MPNILAAISCSPSNELFANTGFVSKVEHYADNKLEFVDEMMGETKKAEVFQDDM